MKSKIICVISFLGFFLFAFLFSCSKKTVISEEKSNESDIVQIVEELSPEEIENQKYQKAINDFINNLSLEEKIGQMFLVTIGGTDFSDSYYSSNNFIAPGGYLLFSYNFIDGEKGINFTSDINNWYCKNSFIKPYFSIDQEGGLVNRLRNVASPLPSASAIAKFLSPELAKEIYDLAGKQLKALGIHVNLGPVVEILTEENKKFLDTRSFGSKEKVSIYSEIFIDSMLENDVYPIVKHFPGNNADDPHFGLPKIDFDMAKIKDILLYPFANINNKNNLGVLVAHSVVPSLFEENEPIPSCLSKTVVTDILINQLGYQGLVFSDDLLMAALQNNGYDSVKSITMAIEAGIDVLMISQKEYIPFIKEIAAFCKEDEEMQNKIDQSVKKIIDFKIKHGILNYSEGIIFLPKELSESELAASKEKSYSLFSDAYNQGVKFYQTYWGN